MLKRGDKIRRSADGHVGEMADKYRERGWRAWKLNMAGVDNG